MALTREVRDRANVAMDRYAIGDDGVFDELYDLLVPALLSYVSRLARGDRARAEDLVQQTFLQMHLARDRYHRGSDVFSWAFAIATRLAIDWVRRRRREVVSAVAGELEVSTDAAPDETMVARQLAGTVERALAAMPSTQTSAYDLVRLQGFSPEEAAEILGTTQNAVNLRVHRAYDAIRSALDESVTDRSRT